MNVLESNEQYRIENDVQRRRIRQLLALVRRAHDEMDDLNAEGSSASCRFCLGHGYAGDGLIHEDDCILVEIRKAT